MMSQEKTFSISLPLKNTTKIIETSKSLLFVGANGSGKTRLGAWIEFSAGQNKDKIHRISAQKSLSMPDAITPRSIDSAKAWLLFGYTGAIDSQKSLFAYKQGQRWHNKPAIALLNDYEALITYLFSDYMEESAKYFEASKATPTRINPPKTKLDQVKELWEKILPHRELIIGGLRIQTRLRDDDKKIYNSSEMSDGERVIFYLIGQCLAAPKDGIIIVDEPEVHLHKSVQVPLWAEIEKSRPDCLFIYLTHDVDFAAAQNRAQIIWLKSFDGKEWDWELIQSDSNLPNELVIEILGSRKPTVFVEGENGSYDVSLYREILPNFLVIPKGSCSQVIQTVKALKANSQFHHLDIYGIIDRDRRVPEEVLALEKDSIFVLKVAEVENLFCTKEILQIVSKQLARNPDDDFQNISKDIFSKLQSELETQVSLKVAGEIKFKLNNFDEKARDKAHIVASLNTLINGINIDELYSFVSSEFDDVINKKDYGRLLALYNRKTLPSQISKNLGLANGSLQELVLRLAQKEYHLEITNALKEYFGNFASKMK